MLSVSYCSRPHARLVIMFAAALILAVCGREAEAGTWMHGGRPRPYRAGVTTYVVVDPAADPVHFGGGGASYPDRPCASGAHAAWTHYDLPAAVYPWGWFGARSDKYDVRNRGSFYGNYRDTVHGPQR